MPSRTVLARVTRQRAAENFPGHRGASAVRLSDFVLLVVRLRVVHAHLLHLSRERVANHTCERVRSDRLPQRAEDAVRRPPGRPRDDDDRDRAGFGVRHDFLVDVDSADARDSRQSRRCRRSGAVSSLGCLEAHHRDGNLDRRRRIALNGVIVEKGISGRKCAPDDFDGKDEDGLFEVL